MTKSIGFLFLAVLLSSCASSSQLDRCKLELAPLTTSYHASGATRLHDMRRLRAVNDARDFCVDGEIKIEEDRASNEKEKRACPQELKSTRIIKVSCPKGLIKTKS